ncbi:PREDICTED: microtubule-associated protein TORTIFOLIA1-like [Ipomoea nil]|uniref:microtubule-associated protein TORTIFOLIA1-like n=1 Tax=Ipomoea nil TaxID=35883 RepID=UPI000900B7C1|nr:PREDICTED: microtubule-associated protein TORTIFOLIA1-like [Ipomoea nil]
MSVTNKQKHSQARDLKHRVLTCLHKLSDRDTHSAAASELESIVKTLSPETIPLFLSSISATDSSDKSPVRKQCLRLISLLSEEHGDTLSPHLSKLLSAVVRRLRDPNSSVRSACIAACASISSHLTKPPFPSIIKPFLEALFTEQEINSQIGAALCLSAAIEGAPDPDAAYLRKLMPRFEKLLKCDSFKAKAALLTLIGSVVGIGGASNQLVVRNLVPCLVQFVNSDDWAARKASVEALTRLAGIMEKEMLSEFKPACLKTIEAKRFDKVKAVRETMNQMLEAWKEIPDLPDDVSPRPQSNSSSKENASDGHYPPGSMSSGARNQRGRRYTTPSKSSVHDSSPATTARRRSLTEGTQKKAASAIFRKLDCKKSSEFKIEVSALQGSVPVASKDDLKYKDQKATKPETRRALFGQKAAGSRVVPYHEEKSEHTVVMSNETGDLYRNQKESEELSQIRKQLVQIETQQSNLIDTLQKFIGSTQSGMHSLETRVHGLELALDEISHDLAVSTQRMSNRKTTPICCTLPGARFFSSRLWKRTGRSSSSQLPVSGEPPSLVAARSKAGVREDFKLESRRRFQLQSNHGFIRNPLAEMYHESQGVSEVSSSGVSKSVNNVM